MTTAVTVYCQGPDCNSHQGPCAEDVPFRGWLQVTAREPTEPELYDFCGWECAIRYGATRDVPEVIEL